jgi:hypothetical protein
MLGINLWPLYAIGGGAAVAGLILLFIPVRRTLRWAHSKTPKGAEEDDKPKVARPGITSTCLYVTFASIMVAVAGLAFGAIMAVASYSVLGAKTLCAVVRAEPTAKDPYKTRVKLNLVRDGVKGDTITHILDGDQWRLGGPILRWSDTARIFGVQPCFKVTRLEGRFRSANVQRKLRRFTMPVDVAEEGWLWEQLQKDDTASKLPFVEAVWGNEAYARARKGVVYEVYATPGGYMIQTR